MAAIWKLAVIFLCQNNRYAEHTKYENCTAVASIATRGSSYDMPAISVDGNDPAEMWLAARESVDRASSGGGPTLIEARSFRRSEEHTSALQSLMRISYDVFCML